jgi:hypothetical protein
MKLIIGLLFASGCTVIYHRIVQYFKPKPPVIDDEPTNQEIRQSPEYRAWRNAVLKRDGYRCIYCHSPDNLEAHHLYSFASFPELRFDTYNGITCCNFHHKLTPNYGSKEKAFSQRIINSK